MRVGVAAAVVGDDLVLGDLEVEDGLITGIGLSGAGSGTALPGFIDLHTHGFDGVDFASASPGSISDASAALCATGVTGFQPTLMTLTTEELKGALGRHRDATYPGAEFLGTHIEGPFLSPAHPGAHAPELLVAPSAEIVADLVDAGTVGQMTIAPELEAALEVISQLRDAGVAVAIGHSDADAGTTYEAIDAGARLLTHVFNASRSFGHRDPGIVGAALTSPSVFVTAVVDNIHLSREASMIVMSATGPDRFVAVTDAMAAAGRGAGTYTLGNRSVTVSGSEARLEDGTIASSVLTMDAALRNVVDLGWDLAAAVRAVSTNPASAIDRNDRGSIEIGRRADIAIVDDDLQVRRTLVGGVEMYAL